MLKYRNDFVHNDIDSVLSQCLSDREKIVSSFQNTWTRRCCLDLLVKVIILYINSYGPQSRNVAVTYVDEIKNSNMQGILRITEEKIGIAASNKMVFNAFAPCNHVKIGRLRSACSIAALLFYGIVYSFRFVCKTDLVNVPLAKRLLTSIENYIELMPKTKLLVLVTDHHFFSTALAMNSSCCSIVLQHGLIQDPSYFTPVRADYFLAWSERSANIVNSKKTIVTGTYKFDNLGKRGGGVNSLAQSASVLLILSGSRSKQQIWKLVQPLLFLQEKYGFSLSVKLHPGSLFCTDELMKACSSYNIDIFKEEPISSIDFDFAFIEQSTAVIDIACLGIPYIVIDNSQEENYFSAYEKLPIARSQEELISLAEKFDCSNYSDAYQHLINAELNGGICRIRETIDSIQLSQDSSRKPF